MKARPHHRVRVNAAISTSKFRAWILSYGVARLARSLVCSDFAVHGYRRGRTPSLDSARKIIALSRIEPLPGGSSLSYEDCFGHILVEEERSVPERRHA